MPWESRAPVVWPCIFRKTLKLLDTATLLSVICDPIWEEMEPRPAETVILNKCDKFHLAV